MPFSQFGANDPAPPVSEKRELGVCDDDDEYEAYEDSLVRRNGPLIRDVDGNLRVFDRRDVPAPVKRTALDARQEKECALARKIKAKQSKREVILDAEHLDAHELTR